VTTVSIITLYAYLQIKDSVQWIPGHFCGMAMRSIDGGGNSPVQFHANLSRTISLLKLTVISIY